LYVYPINVTLRSLTFLDDLAIRCCCLHRHNQLNLNVSILLQTLFINKFHVKSVLKLSVKCTKLLHILKKVRVIAFRRVTCFGILPRTVVLIKIEMDVSVSSWKGRDSISSPVVLKSAYSTKCAYCVQPLLTARPLQGEFSTVRSIATANCIMTVGSHELHSSWLPSVIMNMQLAVAIDRTVEKGVCKYYIGPSATSVC